MFGFDPSAAQHHPKNAYWLGRAAGLAYEDSAEVAKVTGDWDLECHFHDNSGTQVFVAGDAKLVIVSFRGTEPNKVQDILADADLRKREGALGGEVHQGFSNALDWVWEDLERSLDHFQAEGSGKSLWFTGHSLGAALSTLAVARMLAKGKSVAGLYTFGSPRCGNETFAKVFDDGFKSRTFRYVNHNDVVTRVPLSKMNYWHVGTLKYFDEEGRLQSNSVWWERFMEAVDVAFENLGDLFKDAVKDHNMRAYVANLDRVKDQTVGKEVERGGLLPWLRKLFGS